MEKTKPPPAAYTLKATRTTWAARMSENINSRETAGEREQISSAHMRSTQTTSDPWHRAAKAAEGLWLKGGERPETQECDDRRVACVRACVRAATLYPARSQKTLVVGVTTRVRMNKAPCWVVLLYPLLLLRWRCRLFLRLVVLSRTLKQNSVQLTKKLNSIQFVTTKHRKQTLLTETPSTLQDNPNQHP